MGLPPDRRLRKPSEFRTVLKTGKKAGDRFFLMSAARTSGTGRTGETGARYGLSVSKRIGNAVARNRLKRRLRELLRHVATQEQGWDVVISARQAAAEASFDDLRRSIQGLTGRLGIGTLEMAAGRNEEAKV